jgi:hypothetical protein
LLGARNSKKKNDLTVGPADRSLVIDVRGRPRRPGPIETLHVREIARAEEAQRVRT